MSCSPLELNFGKTPFVFDILSYECTQLGASSLMAMTNLYSNIVIEQEFLLKKDVFRNKFVRHPVLTGGNEYRCRHLSTTSLFLDPRIVKNTKFLMDLVFLEVLTILMLYLRH